MKLKEKFKDMTLDEFKEAAAAFRAPSLLRIHEVNFRMGKAITELLAMTDAQFTAWLFDLDEEGEE